MPTVLCLGDVLVDLSFGVTSLETILVNRGSDIPVNLSYSAGGSAANTARALVQENVTSVLIGAMGQDSLSAALEQLLRDSGIDFRGVHIAGERTGSCVIITEKHGERTMFPDPAANAFITASALDSAWPLENVDLVHISAYGLFHRDSGSAILGRLESLSSSETLISLDPSSFALIEKNKTRLLQALEHTDILLGNQEEISELARVANIDFTTTSEALMGLTHLMHKSYFYPESIAVATLGQHGSCAARAFNGEISFTHVASEPLVTSNTTGAGDSFNAGFISEYLKTRNLESSLTVGNTSAARHLMKS